MFSPKVKGTEAIEIYQKMEQKCRMNAKWTLISFGATDFIMCIASSIVHSAICLMNGNLDTSKWFFATQFSVPFDTSIIFNWYLMLILEFIILFTVSVTITTILTYYVNCCSYINACCQHFELIYSRIEKKSVGDQRMMDENLFSINSEINEVVLFHVKIIE